MSSYKDKFPSKWLRAADLDKPRLVTIKKVAEEEVGGDVKLVAYFHGEEQGLGLNVTNCRSVEEVAGTDDVDRWKETTIVIFQTETDYQGKRVPCIRIRAPKPGTKAPEPEEFTADDDDVPF